MQPTNVTPARAPLEHAVKAFVLRAYVTELKRADLFDRVLAKISPATRPLLVDPPPGSTWLDSKHTEHLGEVVSALEGLLFWRSISHDATLNTMVPVLRIVIEGFVRLFGGTPATLFTRLTKITSTSARGVIYDYEATSNRSGVLTVRYPERRNVPLSTFYCCAGGVETIFDICRAKGTLGDPRMVDNGRSNTATFDVSW
jgi:hypothetical protein